MTLREQCEEFLKYDDTDLVIELEKFAKSQQAVVLREAAEYWKQECGLFGPVVAWLEQQAREREGTP